MPIVIRGAKELAHTITGLQSNLVAELTRRHEDLATEIRKEIEHRVSHQFQTVPSYLFESQVLKLPGRREYPPGTKATFARSSPSIKGTAWEKQAQTYAEGEGDNLLLSLLESTTSSTPEGKIVSEIGYAPGIGDFGPTRYLVWVFFGTKKMQPRPILPIALREYTDKAVRRMRGGILKVLSSLPRVPTPPKAPSTSSQAAADALKRSGFGPRSGRF